MQEHIRSHCAQIDLCNQRGGRMLSVVDLIQAGTMSADLAAHALAAIGGGASFLVGAVPGPRPWRYVYAQTDRFSSPHRDDSP